MKAPKISELLVKINRAIDNPAFPAISKIEQDLLKQYVRDLYEEIETVANLPAHKEIEITEPVKKHTEPEPNVLIKRPVMHTNNDMLLVEQPVAQKNTAPVKEEIIVTPKEIPAVEKQEVKIQKVTTQTLTASINESTKLGGSLNEKLKTTSAVEMHKKLASKPLKELIDINKRFVLLSELFKGNTEAYTSAIAHIDTLPDYESAQTFISTQLASNHYWDETKQSVRMFNKLIKIKFGVE